MLLWKVEELIAKVKRQGNLALLRRRKIMCFKIEGSKVCNFTFFLFASQSSINTHSNGQYCCPFMFGKNGRYSKKICFELGNMGLFVQQRHHNYCRISPRVTQVGGRYSVQGSKGCKQVEVKSQYIPKELKIQESTGDISFCFSNLTPITHLYVMETGPLQPRQRCLPNFLGQQKRRCLSPILSNRSGLKKDLITPSNTDSHSPRMANTALVPSDSVYVNKESLVTSKYFKSFDRAKQKNHQLTENQNLSLLVWTVSGKCYLQTDYQKNLPSLLQMLEVQGQSLTTN